MLKPKGIKAVKITLTEIEKDRKFTDCTHFFGAKMYVTHTHLKKRKMACCCQIPA